jgi:hypothetical protein
VTKPKRSHGVSFIIMAECHTAYGHYCAVIADSHRCAAWIS